MIDRFSSKLKSLGFRLPKWCPPPSELLVRTFEGRFSLQLPADYRDFLVHHGGEMGSASCPFQEPTPLGSAAPIDRFYGFTSSDRTDNVLSATKLIDGAPDVIAIGGNLMGGMLWLKCTGRDASYVYLHDPEGRFAWTDSMFHEMFPQLGDEIRQYLELRKKGQLPQKPKGYEHVYQLAKSFTEFVDRLEAAEE
jgi:hypothetical protein